MTKKRLLILNGSHSDIPLIKAGKELGFYVITTGNNKNLIGNKYADEYHPEDFSDKEAILTLAKKLNIDAICSCANDFGCITASYVAEKLGLSGHDSYETTLTLHHKDKFKNFAIPNNISTPYAKHYSTINNALEEISKYIFPIIIKPIDLTGGKGVSIVNKINDCEQAIKKAFSVSKAKRIVIEEFIEGTQHSFTTFLHKGKVIFSFSDNEYSYINPFLVSTSAAPAVNIDKVKNTLIEESNKIASLLNLSDGVFHHQYILKDEKPYIIEITRRCSGDLYPIPVQKATGVDWAKWIVKSSVGMDCSNFPLNIMQKGFYGRHCIMAPNNGIVENIIISDEIKDNIFDQLIWAEKGYKIDNYMSQKVGIVFLCFDTEREMFEKISKINDLIYINFRSRFE